jgi:hypothetical protein
MHTQGFRLQRPHMLAHFGRQAHPVAGVSLQLLQGHTQYRHGSLHWLQILSGRSRGRGWHVHK